MKQLAINLLTNFLEEILKEHTGFKFTISPIDDYDDHWHFEGSIHDEECFDVSPIELKLKVDYLDNSVWIECGENWWEKVEVDRWTCKYFWYCMYCKK